MTITAHSAMRTHLGMIIRTPAALPVRALRNFVLAFAMAMACVGGLLTQAVSAQEQTWKINVKNADLEEFVAQVAEITAKTIVVAPQLKGKVTVVSSANLDQGGVYTLFLSVLRTHGYTAVQSGNTIRVEQQAKGKQNPGVSGGLNSIGSDELVTRVIAAQNVESTELMKILRPLIPQYGHIAAVAQPNVIIITDHADNIKRLMGIVNQIDVTDQEEVVLVPMKHAWVGNIVTLLEQVAPEQLGRNGKGPQRIRLIANERNNSLVMSGKQSPINEIKKLIETLDRPATSAGSTQVFKLEHADAVATADIINGLVGQPTRQGSGNDSGPPNTSSIQADESLNALVVKGDPGLMSEIAEIIAQLDVRRAQVQIEAAIVELTIVENENIGVELGVVDASGGTVPLVNTGTGAIGGLLSSLIPDGTTGEISPISALGAATTPTLAAARVNLNGVSFGAIVQAINTNTNANLLSTPSITTLDNEEARITVGQEVPFLTGSFTTSTDGASNPFSTISREDVAIELIVTPHVHDGSSVRLEVSNEVEDVLPSTGDAVDVVTSKRTIETTVLAEDQEIIVLGGLMQDDITNTKTKVPFFGDIPLLGRLFRSTTQDKEKRALLVFLRPTIIRNAEDAAEIAKRQYKPIYEVEINSRQPGDLRPLDGELDRLFEAPDMRDDLLDKTRKPR